LNNFITRTLSGAVFVAVLITAIWFGPITCFLLFLFIVGVSFFEFNNMMLHYNVKPPLYLNTMLALLCFAIIAGNSLNFIQVSIMPIALAAMFLLLINELYRNLDKPFLNIASAAIAWLYLLTPFVLLWQIGFVDGNYQPWRILGLFILQWTSDTCQYIFGVTMGKHKLFERISPKKSVEGFIGGGLCCIALAYFIAPYNNCFTVTQWMVCAAIIVVFGTLGDLIESMLKRSVGVKDSGNIIPGHGGILDRFDGVFGAMPFVYLYLSF